MRTNWTMVAVAVLATASLGRAQTVVTDQPAALLVYPGVIVARGGSTELDTVIQLSNTSNEPVAAKCFYVNAVGKCSVSGAPCFPASGDPRFSLDCPLSSDACLPQWVETDFRVFLTSEQPLAWLASRGLDREDLPVDGFFVRGPRGESNSGTHVPPFGVAAEGGLAGVGELKCYVTDLDGNPIDRNVLKGEMTIVRTEGDEEDCVDVVKSNAIGHRARPGLVDTDARLVLGGPDGEYDGCPDVLVMDHFFDGATNPVTGGTVVPFLVLAPCTEDFLTQVPTRLSVQYLVFNEFEQRFSTSKPVDCFFLSRLGLIDTSDPSRSVFGVQVAGTLTGQTRIRPVNGGLVGIGGEFHGNGEGRTVTFNLHQQGQRETADVVRVIP
ncbi:MAG: hypothetical protein KatS3mg076_0654 [Candidatus Binatia bacterium]|nr:MAG: hypothetical protein KatS3mg076_0654 [Candidatus Binatia bacterium]